MRSMSGVGISDCYYGHQGIRALYADLDEAFNEWSWTIRHVVDGGDCIASERTRRVWTGQRRGDHSGERRDSGEAVASRPGDLARIVRRAEWLDEGPRSRGAVGVGMDRAEALEAVGLTIMSRARVREQRGSPTTWEHSSLQMVVVRAAAPARLTGLLLRRRRVDAASFSLCAPDRAASLRHGLVARASGRRRRRRARPGLWR